jgi:hypothetical protein
MKELITPGDIDSDGTDTIELTTITRNNSVIIHNGCDHAFTTDEIIYNTRPLIILESVQARETLHCSWDPPNLQNSLLLETAQSEKYNTKHIQTSPFSATLH